MASVNATKYGVVGSTFGSSWTTARETGNFASNAPTPIADNTALQATRASKSGIQYRITRAFLAFDLSAYAGQTISGLTLTFRQTSSTVAGGLVISILKSTAQGSGSTFSDLTTSDFFTTIDFSTSYADFIPTMSSSNSTNIQTLTAAANLDASSGSLRFALVQTQNDKNDLQPSSDQNENGNWNLDTSSSGFIPFLTFIATDWGEKVNGVPVGNIEKVNGVVRNTIESINIFTGEDGCYSFLLQDPNNLSGWLTLYTSVNPPSSLDVDDVVYTSKNCTNPYVGDETELEVGEGGPQNCGTVPTVMAINSDGEITDIQCAPI